MNKGKWKKSALSRNDDNDDEVDLTLRLSQATIEEQNREVEEENRPIKVYDFLTLGGGNSNDEVSSKYSRQYGAMPSGWGGSSTYGGGMAGLLAAPLPPLAVPTIRTSRSTLSSRDQGFLPSTGFATPCRKPPTGDDGNVCRSCGARSSPVWRKGPDGPRTLCNKCGLKHSRYMRRDSSN